jgi:SAM-dependent methyltransferase
MRKDNLERFSNYRKVSLSNHYYLTYMPLIRDLSYAVNKYAWGNVFDIGCGNKPYEDMFKGKVDKYFGCDVVQSSMNKVDIICDSIDIPVESNSVETVFSTQVIEHVADHQQLVKEAYRILKKDGHFIVSGPMYWHLHEEPYDFFRFTKHGFRHILETNGFEVVEILANGGKWALLGQTIIHTIPRILVKITPIKIIHNWFFNKLDALFYDEYNTLNYVVIAKKTKD